MVYSYRHSAGTPPETTPGTLPAFGLAGTEYSNTTIGGTHQPTYPATVGAEEMAIAVMWGRGAGGTPISLSLHADAITAGWTHITGSPKSSTDTFEEMLVAYRLHLAGTEDGAAMEGGIVGNGTETESHVQAVIFTVSAADGFATIPIEDVQSAEETGTTVNGPTVTGSDVRRLAVSIIGFSDDTVSASAFTGASQTWTQRINLPLNLQTDSTIQVQTAPTDVSGGSFTAAADMIRLRFSFAIVPADVEV